MVEYWPIREIVSDWKGATTVTQLRNDPRTLLTDFGQLCDHAREFQPRNGTKELNACQPILSFIRPNRINNSITKLVGLSGWLELAEITESDGIDIDKYILFGCTDEGDALDEEVCRKLIILPVQYDQKTDLCPPDMSFYYHKVKTGDLEKKKKLAFDNEFALLDKRWDEIVDSSEKELAECNSKKLTALSFKEFNSDDRNKLVKDIENSINMKRRKYLRNCLAITELRQHLTNISKAMELKPIKTIRWTVLHEMKLTPSLLIP